MFYLILIKRNLLVILLHSSPKLVDVVRSTKLLNPLSVMLSALISSILT